MVMYLQLLKIINVFPSSRKLMLLGAFVRKFKSFLENFDLTPAEEAIMSIGAFDNEEYPSSRNNAYFFSFKMEKTKMYPPQC